MVYDIFKFKIKYKRDNNDNYIKLNEFDTDKYLINFTLLLRYK